MGATYRDENESLRARNLQLEQELSQRDRRIEELERKLGATDAVLDRLRGVIDQSSSPAPQRTPRFMPVARVALMVVGALGMVAVPMLVLMRRPMKMPTASAAQPVEQVGQQPSSRALPGAPDRLPPNPAPEVLPPVDANKLCSRL